MLGAVVQHPDVGAVVACALLVCSIEELQSLNGMGIDAAILGKSLHTGAIDLAAAVQAVQQEAKGERK